MKIMKKKIFMPMLLSIFMSFVYAQKNDYAIPFYKLKETKDNYFKELIKQKGKEALEGENSEYRNYQRWLSFWQPRIAPNGSYKTYTEIMYNYYKKEKINIQRSSSPVTNNTTPWKELGPYKKPTPGLSSVGGGDLGVGIIKDIVINRQNTNKILGWSLAGGLFTTNDKGLHWQNAGSDNWPRSGCSSADYSPVDENTWYACSNIGGSYYNNSIGIGGGVYRTIDAGLSWSLIADATSFSSGGYSTIINKIVIDPLNAARAYIATNSGLYRSNNVTSAIPVWSLIHNGSIDDFEFRTNSSSNIIIVCKTEINFVEYHSIETSINNGNNWSTLTPFPVIGASVTNSIAIETSDAAPNQIYLLQKTTVSTTNFYIYNFLSNAWVYKSTLNYLAGNVALGVSNFNASTIYVSDGIVFSKSTNGGTTFIQHGASPVTSTNQFHVDVESIVTPPASCTTCSNEVYITTHGGISYSNDACNSIYSRSDGLGIGNGSASNSATMPSKIMIGLDHDGTVMSSGSYSNSWVPAWETVFGGDGMPPLIDYSNPNYVWAAYQNAPPQQPSVHNLSSTGGAANSYSPTGFSISNDFTPKIYQNQVLPDIVYCREENNLGGKRYENLYRMTNRGAANGVKEKISDFKTINIPLKPWPEGCDFDFWMFDVFPTSDKDIAYVCLSTNGTLNCPTCIPPAVCPPVQRWYNKILKNSKMTYPAPTVRNNWVELVLPLGRMGCSTIAKDDVNPNIFYITFNTDNSSQYTELFKADYTNTASPVFINIGGTPASGGLPVVPIKSVVTEKGSNGGIYVGTDVGIFYSNNSMLDFTATNNSQWVKLGTGLPNIPINTMEINYAVNKVRVSTGGRGLWEHDLYCTGTATPNFSIKGILASSSTIPLVNFSNSEIITIDASNTTCESKYYVGVWETGTNWWERTYAYEWGHWFSGQAPAAISLQQLATNSNNYSNFDGDIVRKGQILFGGNISTVLPPPGSTVLLPYQPGLVGQQRRYTVEVSTYEPVWSSKKIQIVIN